MNASINRRRRQRWGSLGIIAALIVSACGADSTTTAPSIGPTSGTSAAPSSPAGPATLRVGISNQINNLDNNNGVLHVNEFNTLLLTSGQLYRLSPKGEPEPELVEGAEVSADGRVITMVLRPGIQYSDGSPVVAEDVVRSLERLNRMEGQGFFEPVEALETPDQSTLVWRLKRPYPDFFKVLGKEFLVIHPKAQMDSDPTYWQRPVSAGPLMIEEWTPGTNIVVLAANPNYVSGRAAVDRVELRTIADLPSRILQLGTGEIDFAVEIPFSAASSLPQEVRAVPHLQGGMFHITINTTTGAEPLRDPRVRRALSLAIDRSGIAEKAFFGITVPAQAMMYTGVPEWASRLPGDGAQNIEAAKQLLAETPWPNGFEFNLMTYGSRPGWKEAAILVAQDLEKIGVKANVTPNEDAVVTAIVRGDRTFDALWTGTVQSPASMLGIQYNPGNIWADAAGYSNPAVTDLITAALVESDGDARKGLVDQIEDIVLEDMPHIPAVERAILNGTRVSDDVFGVITRSNYLYVGTNETP